MLSPILPVTDDSVSHQKVLRSLKELRLPGYATLIEEATNRLDLPNESFQLERKGVAQRKKKKDPLLHRCDCPRKACAETELVPL